MQELLGTIGRVRAINIITTIDITITTRMFSFASLKSEEQMAILRLLLRRAFVQHAWRRRRGGWSATHIQVFCFDSSDNKEGIEPFGNTIKDGGKTTL